MVTWLSLTYYADTLTATDRGYPARSSRATVTIEVFALNQHTPQFVNGSTATVRLLESSKIGFEVARIVANDLDKGKAGEITYSVSSDNSTGRFIVNSTSGALLVQGRFHQQTDQLYQLVIQATDGGSAKPSSRRSSRIMVAVVVLLDCETRTSL